jgi:hypothetical protein
MPTAFRTKRFRIGLHAAVDGRSDNSRQSGDVASQVTGRSKSQEKTMKRNLCKFAIGLLFLVAGTDVVRSQMWVPLVNQPNSNLGGVLNDVLLRSDKTLA